MTNLKLCDSDESGFGDLGSGGVSDTANVSAKNKILLYMNKGPRRVRTMKNTGA